MQAPSPRRPPPAGGKVEVLYKRFFTGGDSDGGGVPGLTRLEAGSASVLPHIGESSGGLSRQPGTLGAGLGESVRAAPAAEQFVDLVPSAPAGRLSAAHAARRGAA